MLEDELTVTMRLMGRAALADVRSDSVDARGLCVHVGAPPRDHLAERTYEPLAPHGAPAARL